MMTTRTVVVAVATLALLAGTARAELILFEDNFNTDSLDPAKWTASVNSGCSLTVTGGVLHSQFDGAGAPRGAYAVSSAIDLPTNWMSFTVTGQWSFPTVRSGELIFQVWDADDSANYIQAAYKTYLGEQYRMSYTGSAAAYTNRSRPTSLTDFELTVTPTHLVFREYRGGAWTTLTDNDTAVLAGADSIQLKIGGWEYSYYGTLQRVDFDNIQVTAVPEPATMALMGLGLGVIAARRRKH